MARATTTVSTLNSIASAATTRPGSRRWKRRYETGWGWTYRSMWARGRCTSRTRTRRRLSIHVEPAAGWGARIRTWEWRNQNPLPYRLATPQAGGNIVACAVLSKVQRAWLSAGRSRCSLLQKLAVHEVAVGIEQRMRRRVEREVDDLADIDRVRAGRDLGDQPAVERHRATLQHRRPSRQARPFAHVDEALVALDAVHAGKALGDLAMVGRQDVDAEEAGLADRIVRRRRLVDADQQLRRLSRNRTHGGCRQPPALVAVAGRDQGHAGGEVAHALLEGGRIDTHGPTLGQRTREPPPEIPANCPAGRRNSATDTNGSSDCRGLKLPAAGQPVGCRSA